MGRDSKSPVILEFNGLPGSGKSTICKRMLEMPDLFNNSLSTSYKHTFLDKYLKTVWLNHNCISFYIASRRYINNFQGNVKNERRDDLLLMYFFRMYSSFLEYSSSKVLLIDQGIVQCLLSVSHNQSISENDSLNRIVSFLQKKDIRFIRVNCKSDVKLSKNRIHSRPTNLSRLDLMDESIVETTLQVQSDNLSIIRNSFDSNPFFKGLSVDVDTFLPPEDNAAIISEYVRKM